MRGATRAREVFAAAIAIEDERARLAFLERECAEDGELLRRVLAMIRADAASSGPLDEPLARIDAEPTANDRDDLPAPRWFGGYEILGELGRGGMGVVYEARQRSPRRRVALKVLAGSPEREMLRRFRNEAEILARLDHPNIARVYEAGAHDDGLGPRPFFAMELVDRPASIDVFVRDGSLDAERVASLFLRVCDAVHHAHQRGVIHRDLKPSNVLVGADGEPRVIDFGVARIAGDADLTLVSVATSPGQLLGTLRYMSPEQLVPTAGASPPEPDVRTDVYAIGLMLYESLTGDSPYPIADASPYDIPRIIRKHDTNRTGVHRGILRGDLATVVLRAIAKDPARRYQTVDALGADLRRYLAGEPIEARRDHALYVLRKSVVRYRLAIGVASAFLLLATGSAVTFALLFERAESARAETALRNEELAWTNHKNLLALAQNALDGGNVREARDLLSRCEPRFRDWLWRYVDGRCDDSVHVFDPPFEDIEDMVPLEGGRRVVLARGAYATAGEGRYRSSVEVWDRTTGRHERTILTHNEPIVLALSPCGETLAIGANDRRVWLVEVASGDVLDEIADLEHRCVELAFSPDGAEVFVSSGGVLSVYGVEQAERLRERRAHTQWEMCFDLSTDGSRVLTSSRSDPRVRLWDARTLELLADLGEHAGEVRDVALTHDGGAGYSGSSDGVVKRWDLKRLAQDRSERLPFGVVALGVSPGGDILRIVTQKSLVLRDERSGALLDELRGYARRPGGGAWLSDGKILSFDGDTVRAWRRGVRGGIRVVGHSPDAIGAAALTIDGDRLAFADEGGRITLADAETGERLGSWSGHESRCRTLAFSPDGAILASGSDDGTVAIWNAAHGSLIHRFESRGREWVRNLAWDRNGRILIVGKDWSGIEAWDVARRERVGDIELPTSRASHMNLSPDRSLIAVGNQVGQVHLIDVDLRTLLRTIDVGNGAVVQGAFFGDNTALVTYGATGAIEFWDLETGERTRSVSTGMGVVPWLLMSPDHRWMVTLEFGQERPVVWDVVAREPLLHLDPGGRELRPLMFAPDGSRLFARHGADRVVAIGAP